MAKLHATEQAQQVIDAAVQLHGGHGVTHRQAWSSSSTEHPRAAHLRGRLGRGPQVIARRVTGSPGAPERGRGVSAPAHRGNEPAVELRARLPTSGCVFLSRALRDGLEAIDHRLDHARAGRVRQRRLALLAEERARVRRPRRPGVPTSRGPPELGEVVGLRRSKRSPGWPGAVVRLPRCPHYQVGPRTASCTAGEVGLVGECRAVAAEPRDSDRRCARGSASAAHGQAHRRSAADMTVVSRSTPKAWKRPRGATPTAFPPRGARARCSPAGSIELGPSDRVLRDRATSWARSRQALANMASTVLAKAADAGPGASWCA
ncbi:MAG: acyl-CoA dehydrogenase family protein [Arhodomonas sp.]|nr:acyl-CoA dehydrogenase family protein [Arhodomonas sp.]